MTRTCSHKSHNKTHFLVCLYAWSSCVESNCLVVLFRMSTLDENISKFLCLYAPVYYVLLDFVSIMGSSTEKHAPTILGYHIFLEHVPGAIESRICYNYTRRQLDGYGNGVEFG